MSWSKATTFFLAAYLSLGTPPFPGLLLVADSDCNRNGRPDLEDLDTGASGDCNANGNPDECDALPVNLGLSLWKQVPAPLVDAVAAADLDGDALADLATVSGGGLFFHWGEDGGRFGSASRTESASLSFATAVDLDRDADLDLVTLGFQSLVIFANGGGRSFSDSRHLLLPATPRSVATADLDGDGDLDLAADGEFEVLLFLEQGRFNYTAGPDVRVGSDPVAVAAGDLDGDGDVDLATANALGNISILLNREGFREARNFAAGDQPSWLVEEDLDGDGDADLAVSHDQMVSIFLNSGTGSFGPAVGLDVPGRPLFLGAADVDGDLDSDLVSAGEAFVHPLFNHGNGRLVRAGPFPAASSPLAAADFDRDGNLEIAVPAVNRSTLHLLELRADLAHSEDCDGDGTPDDCELDCNGNRVADDCDLAGGSRDCNADRVPDECEADCDQNGVPDDCDLRSGTSEDCNANGIPDHCDLAAEMRFSLARVVAKSDAVLFPVDLIFADLDEEPALEIVTMDVSGMAFLDSQGAAFFVPSSRVELGGSIFGEMEAADLDGDGDLDLAVNSGGENPLPVFLNDGGLRFARRDIAPVSGRVKSLLTSDLDGDGDADIAVATAFEGGPGTVFTFLNQGAGSFGAGAPMTIHGAPEGLVAVHLDQDGAGDLALLNGRDLFLFASRGDGTFGAPRVLPLEQPAHFLAAGDFDRDDHGDLVAVFSDGLGALLNDGRGGLTLPVDWLRGETDLGPVQVADLDLNGHLDLLEGARWTIADSLRAFLNDRGKAFRVSPLLTPAEVMDSGGPLTLTSLALGDLGGDGDADLVLGGVEGCMTCVQAPASLRVFENRSIPARHADRDGDGVPDTCERKLFHRGDLDADGRLNVTDPISLLDYLFLGRPVTTCLETADANNDAALDLTDAIHLLRYLFLGGPTPASPGPPGLPCGEDPDPPGRTGDLGCTWYPPCL